MSEPRTDSPLRAYKEVEGEPRTSTGPAGNDARKTESDGRGTTRRDVSALHSALHSAAEWHECEHGPAFFVLIDDAERIAEWAGRAVQDDGLPRYTVEEWADLFDHHLDSCPRTHRNPEQLRICFQAAAASPLNASGDER